MANVPEGLPATVTSLLTLTAIRLKERRVLIKRTDIIEALGAASIIASDKVRTGCGVSRAGESRLTGLLGLNKEKRVLIKRADIIEALGAASIIASDKVSSRVGGLEGLNKEGKVLIKRTGIIEALGAASIIASDKVRTGCGVRK